MLRIALAALLAAGVPATAFAQTLDSGSGEQASRDVEHSDIPHHQGMAPSMHKTRNGTSKTVCRSPGQTHCIRPPKPE